ncbi:MAG TPA: glycosyltransferase family 2 protein [Verrucomicrobiae bacterium]|nr:glycosyltransferase family 2 protein [Verrucomicrobiae bacterium]
MAEKSPISVCIIAGNEAARIRRALESVADWTAEIIVVINDDVKDETDKIAESFGARVFREAWKGFVGQKNSAAEKAAQPWILNLDADEEISPQLRDEIQNVISDDLSHAAFSFPRLTKFCGRWIRHGDWRPDRQMRLWRRGKGRWVGGRIHETPQIDGSTGKLCGDLLHHMADSIDAQIKKISSYSSAFASDAAEKDRGASAFDLLVRPMFRFFRSYILKFGFLDGWQGLYIAWMTAFYTATRYAKIRAKQMETRK